MRVLRSDIVDDKGGRQYEILDVMLESASDELGGDDRTLAFVSSAAALPASGVAAPTVALFYGSTGVRVTGGSSGDRIGLVIRRDGSPGSNAHGATERRFA
jgi:hypothetical protein